MRRPGSSAPLDDWLRWLESLSPREIDLGLERVRDVLERMRLARPARVITVAGTNGKGSSVAMLEALIGATGGRVGSYTSPHVLHYNERIRVDGQPNGDASIVAAFECVEAARGEVPLTYFEYGTLAALREFANRGVDTLILEVGLGGRLDAVNVIDPDACLITNVSLDHCDWLGDDIESIATEKAGIMRAGRPCVFGSTPVPKAIEQVAEDTGAVLIAAGRDFGRGDLRDRRWDWRGRTRSLRGLKPPRLPGAHQLDNAAAVLALLEALGFVDLLANEAVDHALGAIALPGRTEVLDRRERRWLLDGAHNAASALALASAIGEMPVSGRVIAVVGVLADKDSAAIINALAPRVDRWIACAPDCRRALPADDLALTVARETGAPCRIATSVELALHDAVVASTAIDLLLVTGSFYTVGSALRYLDASDDGR